MNIFLDSCVLINVAKEKVGLNTRHNYYINSIVYSEVLYGLLYVAKRETAFVNFLEEHYIEVLVIGKETASFHAKLKLDLNKSGVPVADNDLLIAATCLEHKLKLFTLNVKHFARIQNLAVVSGL